VFCPFVFRRVRLRINSFEDSEERNELPNFSSGAQKNLWTHIARCKLPAEETLTAQTRPGPAALNADRSAADFVSAIAAAFGVEQPGDPHLRQALGNFRRSARAMIGSRIEVEDRVHE
jgi:hypothetical protein